MPCHLDILKDHSALTVKFFAVTVTVWQSVWCTIPLGWNICSTSHLTIYFSVALCNVLTEQSMKRCGVLNSGIRDCVVRIEYKRCARRCPQKEAA